MSDKELLIITMDAYKFQTRDLCESLRKKRVAANYFVDRPTEPIEPDVGPLNDHDKRLVHVLEREVKKKDVVALLRLPLNSVGAAAYLYKLHKLDYGR